MLFAKPPQSWYKTIATASAQPPQQRSNGQ